MSLHSQTCDRPFAAHDPSVIVGRVARPSGRSTLARDRAQAYAQRCPVEARGCLPRHARASCETVRGERLVLSCLSLLLCCLKIACVHLCNLISLQSYAKFPTFSHFAPLFFILGCFLTRFACSVRFLNVFGFVAVCCVFTACCVCANLSAKFETK